MRDDRLFGQLFEDSADAAYLMDPIDDRIIEANPAGCALLGYTREELLTLTVTDIHPAEMPQLRAFLDDALGAGRASRVKFTCRTKHGASLPTDISIYVVDGGGHRYILGLVQDRSEHRSSPRLVPVRKR